MKNVLIYYNRENLAPTGGPRGYLYNLYQGLQKIHSYDVKVSFLDNTQNKRLKNTKSIKEKYDKLPLFLKIIYRIYGRYQEYREFQAGVSVLNIDKIALAKSLRTSPSINENCSSRALPFP